MKTPTIRFSILFILLFSICATIACTKTKQSIILLAPPTDTITPHDTSKIFSYLALGDSYTIGQNVNESERFPAQTVQLLSAAGVKVSTPHYIATTGWTTANLLSAIASQNPSADYDVVTLLIGVNDQYQRYDTATYRTRFAQCLQEAIRLSANHKSHVFVLSIPDYSVTPFVPSSDKAQVSTEIDWFNAINKQISLQNNITYIDITPSTRLAATDSSLIANDGLHPSGKEYKVWADMLAPALKNVLK